MGFEPIRLLVVDDHSFVRATLVDLFAGIDDIVVVGECADGAQVLPAVEATHPDVVLMDVEMPRMDGVTATRALLAFQPDARVLMLTGTISAACIREVHSLGAKGYLLKGDDPSELIARVREVAAGGTAWGSSVAKYLSA
jgi:DNA-binding NarL/FixJ family response regulator